MIKIILLVFLTLWKESDALEASKARTKLILSILENNVNALRSEVDLLKLDTNEIRMMIDELNMTCYYGNQCAIPDTEQENNELETKLTAKNAHKDDGKVEILLQAFQDEKKLYREKVNKVMDYQTNLEERIKSLETGIIAVTQSQRADRSFHAKIQDTQKQKQEQRIKSLEYDIIALKESKNAEKRKFDSEIKKLQEQLALYQNQYSTFQETEQKETTITKDKVNDLQEKLSGLEDMQKIDAQCSGFWRINYELKSCFLFITKKRKWEEAAQFCENLGAKLIEIQSREKHVHMQQLFEQSGLDWGGGKWDSFWAGGSDIRTEGSWEWRDNRVQFKWTNWYTWEPSGGRGENCLSVMISDNNFRWNDVPCSWDIPFICEKTIS